MRALVQTRTEEITIEFFRELAENSWYMVGIHFTFTAEMSPRLLSERNISVIFKNKTLGVQSGKKYTGDAKTVERYLHFFLCAAH